MSLSHVMWKALSAVRDAFQMEDKDRFVSALEAFGKRTSVSDLKLIEDGWIPNPGVAPKGLGVVIVQTRNGGRVSRHVKDLRWSLEGTSGDIIVYQPYAAEKLPRLRPLNEAFLQEDEAKFKEVFADLLSGYRLVEEDGWFLHTPEGCVMSPVNILDHVECMFRDGSISRSIKAGNLLWNEKANEKVLKVENGAEKISSFNPIVKFRFVEVPNGRRT
jgi:hypothetical protein